MTDNLYDILPVLPPAKKPPEWATFIAGRAPAFKIHAHLGHAKNAISGSGHGVLYHWGQEIVGVAENWMPVAIVERGQYKTHWAMQQGVVPESLIEPHIIQEEP